MNETATKLDWIFFDLGSTLTDESVFEKYMFDYLYGSLREFDGKVNRQLFNRALRTVIEERRSGTGGYRGVIRELASCFIENEGQQQTIIDGYSNHISGKYLEMQILYPEAEEILRELGKSYGLGLIANQPLEARSCLADLGVVEYLRVIVLSEEVGFSKPDPRIFLQALANAECEPQRAMMVGDRLDNDVAPAKSLGMMTARVKRGLMVYQKPLVEMEIPDYEIITLKDLSLIL